MKLKEYFALLGIKSNYKFFPQIKEVIGSWEGQDVFFYNWKSPKANNYSFNTSEIEELRTFLKEGDVAIDVGAHVGDSTLPIALACGEKGKVFAFEPNPVVFQILSKNAFLNTTLTNIFPIPFACTDDSVNDEFWYSSPWLGNGGDRSDLGWRYGASFPVPVNGENPLSILIDKFDADLPKVRYIKVDVEGFDIHVLKQLTKLIDNNKPYLKFEVFGKTLAENRAGLYNFVTERGYELRVVGSEGKLFGESACEEDFYRDKTLDIFCIP